MNNLLNRHPADRLTDVRAELKRLEAEEVKLRAYLPHHLRDCHGGSAATAAAQCLSARHHLTPPAPAVHAPVSRSALEPTACKPIAGA